MWVCETGAAIGMPPRAWDRGETEGGWFEARRGERGGATGNGGESVESQEGEFGAEVSAFLSGAACVWVPVYVYLRALSRVDARSCARGDWLA